MVSETYEFRHFNDRVHGTIGVSELEASLIDTHAFQRLRNIRQLGLGGYVFPSAEHSRFSHSLGTLSIMARMCEHLRKSGVIRPSDEKILRLAALLHDIGHYPYSHLGESVYRKFFDPDHFGELAGAKHSLLTLEGQKSDAADDAGHEKLGAHVIRNRKEIAALLSSAGVNPTVVAGIVTGEYPKSEIYCQMMHSGLDCDRLDYLIRDSEMTGVNYGRVDLDYLIRLLRKGKDDKGHDVLGVDKEGAHVVEHYLMGRYFYYTQVVGHRSTRAFECVAKAALALFLQHSAKWPFKTFDSVKSAVDSDMFCNFTDQQLLLAMEVEKDELDPEFRIFFDVVKYRQRPRILWEERDLALRKGAPAEEYSHLRKFLRDSPKMVADALGLDGKFVGWHEEEVRVESLPSKVGIDEAAQLSATDDSFRQLVRLVDPDSGRASLLVTDPTSIISRLADYVMRSLIVFYIEPVGESKVDLDTRFKKGQAVIMDARK